MKHQEKTLGRESKGVEDKVCDDAEEEAEGADDVDVEEVGDTVSESEACMGQGGDGNLCGAVLGATECNVEDDGSGEKGKALGMVVHGVDCPPPQPLQLRLLRPRILVVVAGVVCRRMLRLSDPHKRKRNPPPNVTQERRQHSQERRQVHRVSQSIFRGEMSDLIDTHLPTSGPIPSDGPSVDHCHLVLAAS